MVRYRLVIPLKRSMHVPEYTARGVMVGLAWAFTPTVGIQMAAVFLTWLIARKLFKWDFSVIIGMAWTWSTNFVTAGPIYYLFYLTGQLMLGRIGETAGYAGFHAGWDGVGDAAGAGDGAGGLAWVQQYFIDFANMIGEWGLALSVGCVPWAVLAGWLGYYWSLRFVRRHREARQRRRMARRAGRLKPSRVGRFIREHDPFHRHDGETG
jgi:uncharacterized protein (DUF2062 family)